MEWSHSLLTGKKSPTEPGSVGPTIYRNQLATETEERHRGTGFMVLGETFFKKLLAATLLVVSAGRNVVRPRISTVGNVIISVLLPIIKILTVLIQPNNFLSSSKLSKAEKAAIFPVLLLQI